MSPVLREMILSFGTAYMSHFPIPMVTFLRLVHNLTRLFHHKLCTKRAPGPIRRHMALPATSKSRDTWELLRQVAVAKGSLLEYMTH